MDFGIMVLGAPSNLSHVRSFSIDVRKSSETGSMLVLDLRRIVQGVLSSQAPGVTHDFTIRLHDQAVFCTIWSEMAVTKDGTCLTFKGVHRRGLLPNIVETWEDLITIRKLCVIDCTIYSADLPSLIKSVSSPGWHLDFEDIFFPTHNDRNIFIRHLRHALLHWPQGFHFCRFTNLRSFEDGLKLIKDFEATGIDNIREHIQSKDFLKYESQEDKIDMENEGDGEREDNGDKKKTSKRQKEGDGGEDA